MRRVAAFRVALRSFDRASELATRRAGLTPRQYMLLLLVKGAPDGSECATVGDLCDRLHLAQSTVTELVGRAVDGGLVSARAAAHDGRVTEVRLTSEGERRFAACFETLAKERRRLDEAFAALDLPSPR